MHCLKPYPAMKNSGVPWLGEVPKHWEVKPGRACYREKKIPNAGLKEKTVLSLSYGQIIIRPEEKLHGLVPESFETYQIADPGDIVVRPTDLQNDSNSLRFGLSRHRGIITSAYMCLNTHEPISKEYGYLLLHAYDLKKVFYGLGSGLRQNLDWKDFKYLPCAVPSSTEQSAIVRFLDYADRRIRRHIRAKQTLIELLNEQKQAIIHRAVTRGLDPNVRLKPSGVEWLGDVPEHWEVVPTRYLFRAVTRRDVRGDEVKLSVTQRHGLLPTDEMEENSTQAATFERFQVCEPGDLVLNKYKAHLGVFWAAGVRGLITPS
jgi:type I restriction enzyme S subunit